MKQNPKISGASPQLRALTSLNQAEYEELLSVFSPLVMEKLAHFTLKGARRVARSSREAKNSSLYGSEAKLSFMLSYLKENPTQTYHGCLFGLCQAKVSEWIRFLLPVLEESLRRLGLMPLGGDGLGCELALCSQMDEAQYLNVDVTERQVPRPTDDACQRELYSGKKKTHTIKHLALTNERNQILYLSPAYEGTMHDKRIWEEAQIPQHHTPILADLGFVGIEHTHAQAILPFKKPRKTELRPTQKQLNQAIGTLRVPVEHVFAAIKRLRIIKDKIRLHGWEIRDQLMGIAAAMHNLRILFRSPISN